MPPMPPPRPAYVHRTVYVTASPPPPPVQTVVYETVPTYSQVTVVRAPRVGYNYGYPPW